MASPDSASDSPSGIPSREEKLRQVERILASRAFLNVRRSQEFLRYVVMKAADGQEDEVKEYTIGIQVFRKSPDFDPRIDTLVRTEASRLRSRLERYYATEGTGDDLVVEIPKGHYVPQFSRRISEAGEESTREVEESASIARTVHPRASRPWLRNGIVLGLAGAAIFWAGLSLGVRKPLQSSRGANPSWGNSPVAALWSRLIEAGDPPMVAFSNPAFLINRQRVILPYAEPGMLPLGTQVLESRAQARMGSSGPHLGRGPLSFFDALTGTGEVSAVLSVDRVLRRLGAPVEVKRGRLLTTNDLQRRNVVFVGGPQVNGVLSNLRLPGEFAFAEGPIAGPVWKEYIVNLHPQPGEQKTYGIELDPATGALLVEHALISFLPSVVPGKTIVMLAGIETTGTEAASELATSPAGVQELIDHLGRSSPKSSRQLPPFFEALVRVEYARGMTLGIHYVTGRTIQPQRSALLVGASAPNAEDELK